MLEFLFTTCTTQDKLCDFPYIFHVFEQNKTFTTEDSASGVFIYYRRLVFEIKNPELPVTLKLKAALSSGTMVCPTNIRELRQIRHDTNYTTFSKVST